MMTGLALFRSYSAVSSIIQQLWPVQKSVTWTAPHLLSQAVTFFLLSLSRCYLSLGKGWVLIIDVTVVPGYSTVSYAQHLDQLQVSVVIAYHFQNNALWPNLSAAASYGHKYSHFEGNLMVTPLNLRFWRIQAIINWPSFFGFVAR